MRPRNGVIYQHEYAETLNCTSLSLDMQSNIVRVLVRCLEAAGTWMEGEKALTHLGKTKWLTLGSALSHHNLEISHLFLDRVEILPAPNKTDVNLGEWGLLHEGQMTAVARIYLVHQICPFRDWEVLLIVIHALVTSWSDSDQ